VSFDETLKFLHVLLAVVWVGGGVLTTILAGRARKAEASHRIALTHDIDFVASRVFAPTAILAGVFGVWMVLKTAAWSFGDTWIVIGLSGFVASAVLGMAYLGPSTKKLAAEYEGGGSGEPLFGRILLASRLDLLILLVVIWAMITKPGG
jgi:uncharacterized membrane protein